MQFNYSSILAFSIFICLQAISIVICSSGSSQQQKKSLGYVYWRNATQRTLGSVIPHPKEVTYLNGIDYLSIKRHEFRIVLKGSELQECKSIQHAIDRYQNGYFFDDHRPEPKDDKNFNKRIHLGALKRLTLKSEGGRFKCERLPHSNMDESYSIQVKYFVHGERNGSSGAVLRAKTNWGLLRGLETFSQLIFNVDQGEFAIQTVDIRDEPRFKHRGFMLDTARHYISMDKILRLLDAMSFSKLNVFHWHLVDDQSFPYESYTYPEVSKRAAFRPHLVYSQADVRLVIDYAAQRGIRVVPELDTPGHSYALRFVPNLLTECYDKKTGQPNGDFGPVNPTKESAYQSIGRLVEEFTSVFQDELFHAGGDEVDFDCWSSNEDITRWMKDRNMNKSYEALSNFYIRRLHEIVQKNDRKMLVWQEVFDMGANLPKNDTIIHVWKNINDPTNYLAELRRVLEAGYEALLSSCWYLNYIDYGQDWLKFYQCNPAVDDRSLNKQILGGEICMWTEFVDDTNVVSRTWPRAAAAAERLWSPESRTDAGEFLNRLEQMRCRLLARNVQAEPVNGPGYC